MALLDEMTLPHGVELYRASDQALLCLPAALVLSDDELLPALLDRLLAQPELETLDVRVYEGGVRSSLIAHCPSPTL